MSRPGCKIKVSQASPRAGLPPAPTRCALLLAGGSAGRRPARLRCGNRSSSRRLRCSEAAGNRAGHPAAVHSQRSPLLVKRVLLLVQGGQWTPCRFEGTWITQKKPGGEGGGEVGAGEGGLRPMSPAARVALLDDIAILSFTAVRVSSPTRAGTSSARFS